MNKKLSDQFVTELREIINQMEFDAIRLSKNIDNYGDRHLSHIVKITVGTIQAIRMYVLTNQDVLKNLLVKGDKQNGTESKKERRREREKRTGTPLSTKGL